MGCHNFDFFGNTINQRENIQNLSSNKIEVDEFEDDSLDGCVIVRSWDDTIWDLNVHNQKKLIN